MSKGLPENLYYKAIVTIVVSTNDPTAYEDLIWSIPTYDGELISVNRVNEGYPELEVNVGFKSRDDAKAFRLLNKDWAIRTYLK